MIFGDKEQIVSLAEHVQDKSHAQTITEAARHLLSTHILIVYTDIKEPIFYHITEQSLRSGGSIFCVD